MSTSANSNEIQPGSFAFISIIKDNQVIEHQGGPDKTFFLTKKQASENQDAMIIIKLFIKS